MAGVATNGKPVIGAGPAGVDRPPVDHHDRLPESAACDDPAADLAATSVAAGRIARAAPDADARLDAARRVAYSFAHDFNNVLAAVIGNLQLLKRRARGDDASLKIIGSTIDAALRGSDLANRMQAFAGGQSLERRPVDVNAVVAAMANALKRTAGRDVEVVTRLADDVPHAATDPVLLESAILSLAANARDAMSGRGTLTIETARVAVNAETAARDPALAVGAYACVSVGDCGRGMAPEEIERAFEPFFSTRMAGRGSGIGFSIVSDFVKRSDGHLAVISAPQRGTRIRIFLPAARGDLRP